MPPATAGLEAEPCGAISSEKVPGVGTRVGMTERQDGVRRHGWETPGATRFPSAVAGTLLLRNGLDAQPLTGEAGHPLHHPSPGTDCAPP